MEPRRFRFARHVVALALPLVIALAGCTDRELPTAVSVAPTDPVMLAATEGSRLVSVDAGLAHNCSLRADGTVACWGADIDGSTTPPAGTFTQVSAGAFNSCGVRTDGTVACWGSDSYGQSTPPAGTFTQVSASGTHTCAVGSDGTLACWGLNDFEQATPPAGTFTQVSAGTYHTCGVKTDGTVMCWGYNGNGQATAPAGTFTQVSAGEFYSCGVKTDGTIACGPNVAGSPAAPPAGTFTQVSVGATHMCGVRTDGTVACWGSDVLGSTVAPAGTFTQVTAGGTHSCGLRSDGTIACWGNDGFGRTTPPSDPHGMPGVSAGGLHACAVKADGGAVCWGSNVFGAVGPIPAGLFKQVVVGDGHSCGLKPDGVAVCWGNVVAGQAPVPAGPFTQLSAGGIHTCGVRADGTVACWGSNGSGQSEPVPAGPFTYVSAGPGHSCGVKTDGTVICWGGNASGQVAPVPAGPFRQVATGNDHSCGLKTDGLVVCWGSDLAGQTSLVPTGTFTQIDAGSLFTCGVRTDGTVACWGANTLGQASPPAGTFIQVSAGASGGCGVKSGGAVVCWGQVIASVPSELAGVAPTTTTLTVTPGSQQYSDKVTLTASTGPAAAAGTVQFKKSVDGGATFVDLGGPMNVPGASITDHQILETAGTDVQFKAVFTPTGNYTESSDVKSLTVTKESATIVYSSTNVAALQVGTLATNNLTLALQIKETEPDLAVATKGLGNIANAGLKVVLAPVAGGAEVELICTASTVTGTGYAAGRPYTCKIPTTLSVNTYEVVATVTGDYYTGTYSDAFTVFDPSLGFATGGGSFTLGGDKVNFGFTMKYNKGGTNLQGNFIAVRHHLDGTVSRLKSNALGGLAIGEDANVPMGWASFTGKANYTTWDAAANAGAGAYVTVGNQSFAVYAEDRDNPGPGPDKFWLGGLGKLTMDGTLATAKTRTAALTGGGVAVPHKAASGGGKK